LEKLRKNIWWVSQSVSMIAAIVLCVLFYNQAGLDALTYVGWVVLAAGFLLGYLGVASLKEKGGAPEGKSWIQTTTLVYSGVYALVRHPQYLSWVIMSLALILLSQHWATATAGVLAIATMYMQARQDDDTLIEKFGDDYRRYMESVPRMNIVLGAIRLLRPSRNRQ